MIVLVAELTAELAAEILLLTVELIVLQREEAVELTLDHAELATLVIVLVAVLTFSLAASILEPIVPLIPSQREEAVELIAFHAALGYVGDRSRHRGDLFFYGVDFFADHALIVSQIESTVSLQFSQINRNGSVMIWKLR